jgi:extradiol dioxygenase
MRPVELAYIGCETRHQERWRTIGPELFGFELAPPGGDDVLRLRLDRRSHRLAIHRGHRDRLAYLGWLLADAAAFDAARVELAQAGMQVVEQPAGVCRSRAMTRVAAFTDPFGLPHEICFGPTGERDFLPGRPVSGFVTGDGGAGHVALNVPDLGSAVAFYRRLMGFVPSDVIHDFTDIEFFHCNPRHHSVGLAHIPMKRAGIHHFMVEVRSVDDVGVAYELCRRHRIPITATLGRHPNDRMFSFYCRVPGGFEIEYGCGGLRIEDDSQWRVASYDRISDWGHVPPAGAALLQRVVRLVRKYRQDGRPAIP